MIGEKGKRATVLPAGAQGPPSLYKKLSAFLFFVLLLLLLFALYTSTLIQAYTTVLPSYFLYAMAI